MATLSDLQARREALLRAMQSPTRAFEHANPQGGSNSFTYRNYDELRQQLADLDGEIASLEGTKPPRRVRIIPAMNAKGL